MRIYEITSSNLAVLNLQEIEFDKFKKSTIEAIKLLEKIKFLQNKTLINLAIQPLNDVISDANYIIAMEWELPDDDIEQLVPLARNFLKKLDELKKF